MAATCRLQKYYLKQKLEECQHSIKFIIFAMKYKQVNTPILSCFYLAHCSIFMLPINAHITCDVKHYIVIILT